MNVKISPSLQKHLINPNSQESRAFFEGARAMLTAIRTAPASEYTEMLASANQQHIIALLVKSEEQALERRLSDIRRMLSLYHVDRDFLRGFIFNRPRINSDGVATDASGYPLEDSSFCPLVEMPVLVWPDCSIRHYDTNTAISVYQYYQLSESEREDYIYTRYFTLGERYDGSGHPIGGQYPKLKISSSDHALMAELIRQDILTCGSICERYMEETLFDEESGEAGLLYGYREEILEALDAAVTPEMLAKITQPATNLRDHFDGNF